MGLGFRVGATKTGSKRIYTGFCRTTRGFRGLGFRVVLEKDMRDTIGPLRWRHGGVHVGDVLINKGTPLSRIWQSPHRP